MLVEVNKQITEKVEISLPCCIRTKHGFHMITGSGDLITVYGCTISAWHSEMGVTRSSIAEACRVGTICKRPEFDRAYKKALRTIATTVAMAEQHATPVIASPNPIFKSENL